jgi:DDE superfamily endonuclease
VSDEPREHLSRSAGSAPSPEVLLNRWFVIVVQRDTVRALSAIDCDHPARTARALSPVWSLEHDDLHRRSLWHDRIEAPWLLDRPINGDSFLVYVVDVLVPTLRPGDIVNMDNLQSHKRRAVRDALRRAGAKLLFLPKYSPDLNPIEQVFAKI